MQNLGGQYLVYNAGDAGETATAILSRANLEEIRLQYDVTFEAGNEYSATINRSILPEGASALSSSSYTNCWVVDKNGNNVYYTSNVSAVADVITKQVMGENTTTEQNNTLKNSQYGARVLNELSPENIQSDNYSSEWVKNIGTYGTNASLYNQANGSAVDNDTVSSYNGTRGDINGSTNTGLLAGGKVSAVGGGNNSLREQSANTGKINALLGTGTNSEGVPGQRKAGSEGWLSGRFEGPEGNTLARNTSFLGSLRRIALKDTDSAGRKLSPELMDRLQNTVLKTEDGTVISLFHFTDAEFEVFAKGDIGFHFGTLDAAANREKDPNRIKQGNERI